MFVYYTSIRPPLFGDALLAHIFAAHAHTWIFSLLVRDVLLNSRITALSDHALQAGRVLSVGRDRRGPPR